MMSFHRPSIVSSTLPVLLVMGLGPMAADAWARPAPVSRAERSETTLASYRRALMTWMPVEARRRLREVDLPRTEANPAALAWVTADFAVRFSAPWALTALNQHSSSARLRGLAPVMDRATARDAIRQIQNILWRLDRMPRAWQPPTTPSAVASLRAAQEAVEHALEANGEPALTPFAAPAVSATEHARLALMTSATAAYEAVRAGASQERLVDACIQHLQRLADRAR